MEGESNYGGITIKKKLIFIFSILILVLFFLFASHFAAAAETADKREIEEWTQEEADGTIYWLRVNKDGQFITGWHLVDDTWYYFEENGRMADGNVQRGSLQLRFQDGAYQDIFDMPVAFSYPYRTAGEIETAEKYLQEAVEFCLEGKTKFQQAYRIHDWVVQNLTYNDRGPVDVTGALLTRTSICHGYANVYKAIAEEMGFHCEIITSTKQDHAWNYIVVNDTGYYVDTTWSDTSSRNYNMLSKERMNRNHKPDNPQHQ